MIPLVTYVASWSGWLITGTGYGRDYAQQHGVTTPVISALYSLFEYHKQMLQFDVTLNKTHPYMSQPWGWMVISRPVAFFYQCYTGPSNYHVCPAGYTGPQWSQEVLAIGNPAIWWAAIPAMIFCLAWWLTRRDWRAGAAVLGVAAGWVTWMPFVSRTKFNYYALEFEPFMILCIVLCLGLIIGPVDCEPATPRDRLCTGWQLCPCRDRFVLVFLPDPCGQDHSVLLVAVPHVVPRLDLARHDEAPRSQSGLIASFQLARNVATYLKVI